MAGVGPPRPHGRDGVHQHAARVGGLAAGHIDAHAVQRRDLLAQQRAVFVAVAPALARGLFLRLVVAAHAGGGGLQRVALHGGNGVESGLELGLRQLQRRHGVGLQAVKALRCIPARRIAALLHVGQDVGHALLDGRVGVGRPMQAGCKISLKSGAVVDRRAGAAIKVIVSFGGWVSVFFGEWPRQTHR
jgi:hypothetical protein